VDLDLARFTHIIDTKIENLGEAAAVADESDLALYVSAGSELFRINSNGSVVSWEMPNRVNTLISALGSIWVGAGDTVYRITGDNMKAYTQISGVLGVTDPIFCISKNDLFAADGMVYRNIEFGTPPLAQSFLATSEISMLPIKDLVSLSTVKSGMGAAGVYCGNSQDQDIFARTIDPVTGDWQLVRILPL
jgi:hypothetical protein